MYEKDDQGFERTQDLTNNMKWMPKAILVKQKEGLTWSEMNLKHPELKIQKEEHKPDVIKILIKVGQRSKPETKMNELLLQVFKEYKIDITETTEGIDQRVIDLYNELKQDLNPKPKTKKQIYNYDSLYIRLRNWLEDNGGDNGLPECVEARNWLNHEADVKYQGELPDEIEELLKTLGLIVERDQN